MIKKIISAAKEQFAKDYSDDPNLNEELTAFEEGMITAFRIMFEQSLHGSISFDIVEGESVNN